jgi:hypothetical protein
MLENQGPRVAFEAILGTPPQNQWLAGQVNREFRAALWLTRTCISTSTRLVLSPAHISVPSRFPTTTTQRQHRGARLSRTSAVCLRYEPQKDPMCKCGAIIKCRSVVSHKSHRPKADCKITTRNLHIPIVLWLISPESPHNACLDTAKRRPLKLNHQ